MSENNKWPYNTRRWRKIREMRLSVEPLCRYCQEVGRVEPAVIADHIVPVREAPELAFDFDNTQSLCPTCHESVKKREEATGNRVGCGVDGVPLGGWVKS